MPPSPLPPVCIIGAGLAGLAAAHALAAAGVRTLIIEKSRGVGGRAATRWHDAPGPGGQAFRWRVDHGAQVFTPEPGSRADRLARSVAEPTTIAEPVVPFDDGGTLHPAASRTDGPPRLAFGDGYAALGRALADATPDLDLRPGTTATRLVQSPEGWTVEVSTAVTKDAGRPERLGPFRAVLLTPPAPQAAALVTASAFDDSVRDALADTLAGATYRRQFTVVLAFDTPVRLPGGAYALVNVAERPDGERPHPVAWLADETRKPGRAPAGAGLLIAQMSDAWTGAHYDTDRAEVVTAATAHVEALAGPLPRPLWTDTQRWRYALPDATRIDTSAVHAAAVHAAEALGLYVAGDAVAGSGRAHLALENGLDVAGRIRTALG